MADIFISYSKADHTLALKLSAFLEAEGWSVWWDRNLSAGEAYRDEIMRELSVARAVIVIWTQASVKSDWARAEAGRAKAEGKLIPVKASGLTYSDIPLPFGEMHTENFTATDLIRAAVVAQLSKPAVAPSSLWLMTRTIRLQSLTWAGIIGGSVTIFSNLRGFLNLADWARWIVTHWHEWTQALWTAAFSWIGIHIHRSFVPPLSFTAFLVMVVTGTILRTANPLYRPSNVTHSKARLLTVAGRLGIYVGWTLSFIFVQGAVTLAIQRFWDPAWPPLAMVLIMLFGYATFLLVPFAAVIWASKERLQCLTLVTLLTLFCIALAVAPLGPIIKAATSNEEYATIGYAAFIIPLVTTSGIITIDLLAPMKSINQRLLFLAIGALSLVALNMVSVFGFHHLVDAPKPPL
jgi:TIR domain-containing protein